MKLRSSQQGKEKIALFLILAALPLSFWSFTYTEIYRNWRWQRTSVPVMQRLVVQYPNDPTLLYHLGTRLSQEQRYVEALPFLERAVGISLEKAEYRDAWAKALLATGQISQAFAILSQYSQTHPRSAEGHLYLGRFYIAQNATKRASEELERATSLKPNLTEAWWLQAVAHQAQNQLPLAVTKIRKAVEQDPRNAVYQGLLGELLVATGDQAGALQAFDAALKQDPALVPVHVFRARILLDHSRDAEAALQAASRAVELDAKSGEAHFQKGRALLALQRADEAIPELEKAASLSPNDPSPVMELRRALTERKRSADADKWEAEFKRRTAFQTELRTLQDTHRQRPDDPQTARKLARFWAGQGNYTLAVRYHAKALRAGQDAPPVLIAAANDLTEAGYPDLAMDLLKRVEAETSMNPASFEAMGNALLAKGMAREAALKFETVARWQPQKRAVLQKKLDTFFAKQAAKPTEAMRLFAKAVQLEETRLGPRLSTAEVKTLLFKAVSLEPKNTTIRREWARILFERRERAEAIKAARELLELSPDDTVGHALLGVLLVETASTEEEFNTVQFHLNKAKADPVMSATVYYGAGSLALRRQQPDAALVALRTARQLAPNSDPICYALAQAERLNGNEKEAQKLLQEYQRNQQEKQAEVDLLKRIADSPNQPALYREAVAFYEKRSLKAQAAAIRQEMRRRFNVVN